MNKNVAITVGLIVVGALIAFGVVRQQRIRTEAMQAFCDQIEIGAEVEAVTALIEADPVVVDMGGTTELQPTITGDGWLCFCTVGAEAGRVRTVSSAFCVD